MSTKLKDIVSIGGKPGLHKIIGQRSNGLIVESLEDGKKFPTSITQKVSILSEISMYTYEGDASLRDVMAKLHEKVQGGLGLITKKSGSDEVKNFLRDILPDFDENKVYTSDILKLVNWYQILAAKCDMDELLKEEEEAKEEKKDKPKPKKAATKDAVSENPKKVSKVASKVKSDKSSKGVTKPKSTKVTKGDK